MQTPVIPVIRCLDIHNRFHELPGVLKKTKPNKDNHRQLPCQSLCLSMLRHGTLASAWAIGLLLVGGGYAHGKPKDAPTSDSKAESLPDPAPPFEANVGKRVAAEFNVSTFEGPEGVVQQPALWFGNKHLDVINRLGYRPNQDNSVSLYIDNREVLLIQFWGSLPNLGFGYPFQILKNQPPKIDFDAKAKAIKFTKPYALTNGKNATFTWTLKSIDAGKAELVWDCGVGEDADKNISVGPWIHFSDDYRSSDMSINDEPVDFPDLSTLADGKPKELTQANHEVSKITVGPDSPLKGFSLEFGAKTACSFAETLDGKRFHMKCSAAGSRKGSIIIDMALSAVASKDAQPPVAGVDFWKHDAVHVTVPANRNMVPNGSFEQGLRYWKWGPGGGKFRADLPQVYTISNDGMFGGKALSIHPYDAALPAYSMPIAVESGKTYTLSYYVKAEQPDTGVSVNATSGMRGSQLLDWQKVGGNSHRIPNDEVGKWVRKSRTFVSDTRCISISVSAGRPVLIDGIQMEEGDKATEYIPLPVEGRIESAFQDNALDYGKPFDAKFILTGKPGSHGSVKLVFRDFNRTEVGELTKKYQLDTKGNASYTLPLENVLGKGIFVVKAIFMPEGSKPYVDFYRLSIIKPLENRHPSKDLFGNNTCGHITRGADSYKMFMRWGWGSTTGYNTPKEVDDYFTKYRISYGPSLITYNFSGFGSLRDEALINKFQHTIWGGAINSEDPNWNGKISETDAKFIEDTVYDSVKANNWCKSWALSTESEGSLLVRRRNFAEYAKVLEAFHRGVKRAIPDAKVYPDGGTSGYSDSRGFTEMEGYLASTDGKVKWDAIAVHPYGNLDGVNGTNDMDTETKRLVDQMKRHGYGTETPIDYDECSNTTFVNIPEWGDTGSLDDYGDGLPSYDSGWKEYRQACWIARTYLMCMKYWPQLRSCNIWSGSTFMDQEFTPVSFCMVPNSLGNLFPNPKFKADIRPAGGIRGYAFENGDEVIAALWCAIDKVDEGIEHGPEINVRFAGLKPEFLDLMGNVCNVPLSKDHSATVRLTPAPMFIRVKKSEGDKLVAALSKAEVTGVGNSLKVSFLPKLGGEIEAKLVNLTGNPMKGALNIKGQTMPFEVPPMGSTAQKLPFKLDLAPSKIESWKQTIGVEFANGKRDDVKWDMSCFTVPHAAKPMPANPDDKEWDAIPALPVNNWVVNDPLFTTKFGQAGDLTAKFQLAWDKENLYLRVSCVDDKFVPLPESKWNPKALYGNDGCVELYLDTIGIGRSNSTKNFDQYDYRYDFAPGNGKAENGPGSIYREHEVFCQLAGGMSMPTKEQAAAGIKCEYRRNGNSYSYVMILPQMYIEPLHLEKGWRAGFGLFIHDKDTGEKNNPDAPEKGVSLATKKGMHCNYRPDLWPIIVLGD